MILSWQTDGVHDESESHCQNQKPQVYIACGFLNALKIKPSPYLRGASVKSDFQFWEIFLKFVDLFGIFLIPPYPHLAI